MIWASSFPDTCRPRRRGILDGRSIAIEYRWAEGVYQRLPALAGDLVNRKVAVIAAISGTPAALAAKAATTTIPIVFAIGGDPVTPGLVASLNRPGGNVTGVSFYNSPVVTKRLDLARELVPDGSIIALLGNPDNPGSVEETKAAESCHAAARRRSGDAQCPERYTVDKSTMPCATCQAAAGPRAHRKF